MTIQTGVFMDSFDPVRIDHLTFCRSAVLSGETEQVFLVLLSRRFPCTAGEEDRWKMLVSACAGSKELVPVRFPFGKNAEDTESILRQLRKKHPGDKFRLLNPPESFQKTDSFVFSGNSSGALCPSVQEYCRLKGLYGSAPSLPYAGIWINQLFDALNPHRFAHSLAVAATSVRLAIRYKVSVSLAETAGLLHDCAKCLPYREMKKIATEQHLTEDPEFLASPSLLHSIAGAWVARVSYGIEDENILDAIRYHNTGYPGMSRLAMCVCLADYIEPNRDWFPLLDKVRALSDESLEEALLLSLEGVAGHVASKGKTLHPRTLQTIEWLKSLPSLSATSGISVTF